MNRSLIVVVMLLSALGASSGVSAAPRQDRQADRGHHYFWIETPVGRPDRGCDFRNLSSLINRGDICPAADAPLVPPLVEN